MSEHREALNKIMELCATGRTYTRRMQCIHNVAMTALGMTANQRNARHLEVFVRVGDNPGRDAYLTRQAKREAKFGTRHDQEPA